MANSLKVVRNVIALSTHPPLSRSEHAQHTCQQRQRVKCPKRSTQQLHGKTAARLEALAPKTTQATIKSKTLANFSTYSFCMADFGIPGKRTPSVGGSSEISAAKQRHRAGRVASLLWCFGWWRSRSPATRHWWVLGVGIQVPYTPNMGIFCWGDDDERLEFGVIIIFKSEKPISGVRKSVISGKSNQPKEGSN